jgi:hypothetical protein
LSETRNPDYKLAEQSLAKALRGDLDVYGRPNLTGPEAEALCAALSNGLSDMATALAYLRQWAHDSRNPERGGMGRAGRKEEGTERPQYDASGN